MSKGKAQSLTHLPNRSIINTLLTNTPEATCNCNNVDALANLRMTDGKQLPDCMVSPTLLRHSPRTSREPLSDLQTHRHDEDDRSQHRLAHFLRILKPDLAITLTVQGRERGNRRYSPRAPNLHGLAARVPVSSLNHDEGVRRSLQHHRTANPNLLLNLKVAVAKKGNILRYIGAPTPSLEPQQGHETPNGQVWSVDCTVRKQPTRLIDWQ